MGFGPQPLRRGGLYGRPWGTSVLWQAAGQRGLGSGGHVCRPYTVPAKKYTPVPYISWDESMPRILRGATHVRGKLPLSCRKAPARLARRVSFPGCFMQEACSLGLPLWGIAPRYSSRVMAGEISAESAWGGSSRASPGRRAGGRESASPRRPDWWRRERYSCRTGEWSA